MCFLRAIINIFIQVIFPNIMTYLDRTIDFFKCFLSDKQTTQKYSSKPHTKKVESVIYLTKFQTRWPTRLVLI